MFITHASQFYQKLNGTGKEENISPDPDEATRFSSDIWRTPITNNQDVRQLQKLRQELNVGKQGILRSRFKVLGNVSQVCQIGSPHCNQIVFNGSEKRY